MSGIVAVANWDGRPVQESDLLALAKPAEFRARAGVYCALEGSFGVAVLSGRPGLRPFKMHQEGQDFALMAVADAALYDRQRLLDDLSAAGQSTKRGASDSEIILKAYLAWGTNCPDHLVGEFSFIVVDPNRKQILCARDTAGIRCLHYYTSNNHLLVATDIRSLLIHARGSDLDARSVSDLLCVCNSDQQRTIYADIRKLPPSHSLLGSPKTVTVQRYWFPERLSPLHYPAERDYFEHFRELVFEAVQDRLPAHERPAVLLSGGIDSSLIAAVLARSRVEGENLKDPPFCINFFSDSAKETDERSFVECLEGPGLEIYYQELACENLLSFYQRIPSHVDSPERVNDPPLFRALDLASVKGCSRLFNGHGGDELFFGGRFAYYDYVRSGRWWKIRPWIQEGMSQGYSLVSQLRSYLLRPLLPAALLLAFDARRARRRFWHLPPWLKADFTAKAESESRMREDWVPQSFSSFARQKQFGVILGRRIGSALEYEDRLTVARGLRPTAPLLDRRLTEFSLRIPLEVCAGASPAESKKPIRMGMGDLLPDQIRNRRDKGGGNTLLCEFLRQDRDLFTELSKNSRLAQLGVLEPGVLLDSFEALLRGDTRNPPQFFLNLAMLELWLQDHHQEGASLIF